MRTVFTDKWGMTGLDLVSDPANLAQSDGRKGWIRDEPTDYSYAERFDAIKMIRQAAGDLATYTNAGRIEGQVGPDMKRVASIPQGVMVAALALEPDLLANKKKFYAWLDRHPEYCTYNRVRGAR